MRCIWMILAVAPFLSAPALADSSIMTTLPTTSTTTTTTSTGGSTTATSTGTNASSSISTGTASSGTAGMQTTHHDSSNYHDHSNNNNSGSTHRTDDLDSQRYGFDDPRDPWDGRYSNDNPDNYTNSGRPTSGGYTQPSYAPGASGSGVHYGPVHSH